MTLDPRLNAYRADKADISLRGQIQSETYIEPTLRQCLRGVVPLRAAPQDAAPQLSQIRYGEFVDIFETRDDGYVWVQNRADHYVGYMRADDNSFGDSIAMLSNRVTALRTFVYPKPNLKATPVDELTLGSFLALVGQSGKFLELAGGGFVFAGHVMATEYALTPDYVFTAGRLLHTPYLWGGRTPKGIDCSGLTQLALEMAGFDAPRDCDQQAAAYGQPLATHWRDMPWRRGDIVFFKDNPGFHVGFMTGTDSLIHANATSMDVTVEPLADVVARGVEIISVAPAAHMAALRAAPMG